MATTQGPGASPRPATLTPAIIILGADTLLAARPASPAQLVNACYAAGYSAVIPSSWGDELVAARYLREIASRGQGSVVLCACPRVAEQMRRVHSLLPQLLPLVSPPVAAARYLRARAGRHGVNITYVGDCPGGTDPAIDRHATPGALLRSLAKRGIHVATQPTEVDERLLRDARRFYSLPGGAPAPNWLYVEKRGYTLVEPGARDFLAEVAFRVSKRERRVVDLAPRLGCACSGAVVGQPWTEARDKVAGLEPPRAVHEVLDHDVPVDLSAPLEPWTGSATDGEPTVPIALEALAAMYDADTRASTIRTLAPAPLPRRARTSGGKAAEPTTPSGVGEQSSRPPVQPIGYADAVSVSDSPLARRPGDTDPTLPATDGVEETPVATHDPERDAAASSPAAGGPPESTSTTQGSMDELPRRAGATGDEEGTNPDTAWIEWQPRSSRIFQWLVLGACILLAAGATTLVGMLLLGRATSPTANSSAPSAAPSTPADSNVADTSTRPADTSATPASGVTPTAAPTSARDSATTDTTEAEMPAMHDLPRLPIRPTSAGGLGRGTRGLGASDGGSGASQGFSRNPAPVYSPGAAPIPRTARVGTGPSIAPSAPTHAIPSPDTAAASPVTAAEAATIRAEIARRRHRVDSLRQVLDSLAKKTAADSP